MAMSIVKIGCTLVIGFTSLPNRMLMKLGKLVTMNHVNKFLTATALSGCTPQIQPPIGIHTNSSLKKKAKTKTKTKNKHKKPRYFLTLKSCRCSEIIDFPLENRAFYQIRSSTGTALSCSIARYTPMKISMGSMFLPSSLPHIIREKEATNI